MSSVVGTYCTIESIHNQQYKGHVYSYDVPSDIVILQTTLPQPHNITQKKYDFHILKISSIKEITPLTTNEDIKEIAIQNVSNLVPIKDISIQECIDREKKAIAIEKQAEARVGKSVSPEAQSIFDALAKTLPVHWENDSIVVMDECIIERPYTAEKCVLVIGKTNHIILERVRKVLRGERRRLGYE